MTRSNNATATAGGSVASSSSQNTNDAASVRIVQDDESSIGPYSIGEEIGRGSFATVYKGKRKDTGDAVAIKSVIRGKLTTKLLENLESEIAIMKRIRHRYIVELKDCLKTDSHIYLVMAFCSAGDLSVYIKKRGDLPSLTASNQGLAPDGGPPPAPAAPDPRRVLYPHPKEGGLNETIVRCFLGQLTDALKFLRAQDVIHRDIKPQNLLLQPPGAEDLAAGHPPGIPILKVADFGFARWLPSQSLAETLCGSPLYMAPEILRYERYGPGADLWSTGAVLYEMCVGKPPFRAQNHVDLLRKIDRGEDKIKFPDERERKSGEDDKEPPKPVTRVAEDIKALIRRLLKRMPGDRMDFPEFFKEAAAVASGGSASGILRVSASPSPSTKGPAVVRAVHRAPLPTPSGTASKPGTPRPSDRAEEDASVAAFAVTAATAAYANPVPPASTIPRASTSATKQPSPTTTAARPDPSPPMPAYVSSEPLPFARRPSSQTNVASLNRRQSSFAGRLPPSPDPGSTSPTEAGQQGPPSAIERFNAVQGGSKPASEGTDSTDSLGKEYVVVEKRTVEINALADELASAPKAQNSLARRPSRGFLTRPASALGPITNTAISSGTPYPPTNTTAITSGEPSSQSPPFALAMRPNAANHPYSISSSPRPMSFMSSSPRSVGIERFPGSPLALVGNSSAAIAKALNMASLKIFGSPTDGILLRRRSTRKAITRATLAQDPQEERTLAQLEDIAQKALVISDFADSKIMQLLPPTPHNSSSTSLGTPSYFTHVAAREQTASNPFSPVPTTTPSSPAMRRTSSSSSSERPLILASSVRADVVAAEALVLYMKALAFLGRGIEKARHFWANRANDTTVSSDFNEAVQWLRQRFNECFDKAEYAKSRCQDEIPESATWAEKLLYDRALEISRAAAVNELKGINPSDCETAYETALCMLNAILDESVTSASPAGASRAIEDDDHATVARFVASITNRLQALRRKIG